MVEEFVQSMQIEAPHSWKTLSHYEKMRWLGEQITPDATDRYASPPSSNAQKWEWWRAHRSSLVIREILQQARPRKPIFLFVLGWKMGHEHGQDPVMFHDAGADIISVMLYESDLPRWKAILELGSEYLRGDEGLNLLIGEMIDSSLIGRGVDSPAPEVFTHRLTGAMSALGGSNSQVRGFFWHDLARGNWGKIEPYSREEWLIAGATAISKVQSLSHGLSSRIIPEEGRVKVVVENRGRNSIQEGFVRPLKIPGSIFQIPDTIAQLLSIPSGGKGVVEFPLHQIQDSIIEYSSSQLYHPEEWMIAFEIQTGNARRVEFCYLFLCFNVFIYS